MDMKQDRFEYLLTNKKFKKKQQYERNLELNKWDNFMNMVLD